MNKKILVPLGRYDRSEEMIPYVERVARPGMTVVFLVRYPVDGFIWAKEEEGMGAAQKTKELLNYYSWERNLKAAEKRTAPACKSLSDKGIEASVEVYAGSLKKTIRSHSVSSDVHLIVTRDGIAPWGLGLFDSAGSIFNGFRRSRLSPVLLTQVSLVH